MLYTRGKSKKIKYKQVIVKTVVISCKKDSVVRQVMLTDETKNLNHI